MSNGLIESWSHMLCDRYFIPASDVGSLKKRNKGDIFCNIFALLYIPCRILFLLNQMVNFFFLSFLQRNRSFDPADVSFFKKVYFVGKPRGNRYGLSVDDCWGEILFGGSSLLGCALTPLHNSWRVFLNIHDVDYKAVLKRIPPPPSPSSQQREIFWHSELFLYAKVWYFQTWVVQKPIIVSRVFFFFQNKYKN